MILRFCLAAATLLTLSGPVTGPASALDLERRRMLTAEEHKPWKAVGRVNVAARSEQGMCTGTLIEEDLVITAAHCVYSSRTGQLYAPGNIHFVAGWRRGSKVAHRKAAEIAVHPGYKHGSGLSLQQIGSDLALIRLEKPIPEDVAPHFVASRFKEPETPLTLISYRRDRAHALTRQDGCDLNGLQGAVVVLNCDVTFGASGSPVFAEVDGQQRIVAVISAKGQDKQTRRALAFAVRLDATMPTVVTRLR
ncbi:MAG: trypsin-like serine protease [Pseudomonadota bacterium]